MVTVILVLVFIVYISYLTLLHSERPKLYGVLAFLSAIGLNSIIRKSV